LERELGLYDNSIKEISKTLTVDDEGEITEDNNTSHFAKSQSRISFHGIEIPSTIFPDSWVRKPSQVSVVWPFPMLVVLDICGNRDLDLNSPRTEILLNDKWVDLEEELAFQICTLLSEKVTKDYWKTLVEICEAKKGSKSFLRGLNRIKKDGLQTKRKR
jgi:molecular chaperone HtpG